MKAPVEPGNMKTIFNGKDLTGWDGDSRLWSVEQGVIRGETTKDKKANGNTFLIWQGGRTKDFDLRISFKVSTQNNSGIQYRSKHITEKARNKWVVRGYQHEIRNSNKMPNVPGFIYAEGGKRGRMCLAGQKVLWNSEGNKEVLGTVISDKGFAKLFTVDEGETERINSARVTCSRLKAFDRTKMKTQYDLDALTLSQARKQELSNVQNPNSGAEHFTPR